MINETDISINQLMKGIGAADMDAKYAEARKTGTISDKESAAFFAKIATEWFEKRRKYGNEFRLSLAQKALGIKLIKKYAPIEIQRELDLIPLEMPTEVTPENVKSESSKISSEIKKLDETNKELVERVYDTEQYDDREARSIQRQIEINNERIRTLKIDLKRIYGPSDVVIRQALGFINPYMTGEKQYLKEIIEKADKYRGFQDFSRPDALKYISNYREQMPQEIMERVSFLIPSESEREPFYLKFTTAYLKFLVSIAKSAVAKSLIVSDVKTKEFIETNGTGPKINRTRNMQGYIPAAEPQIERFKKVVDFVQKKLEKNAKSGKLGNIGNYMISDSAFEEIASSVDNEDEIADYIAEEQEVEYTSEQKQVTLDLIRMLAEMCDYAQEEDHKGFSKTDTMEGHHVAELSEIPNKMMPTAVFWCRKYRRQLPENMLEIIGISKKAKKEKRVKSAGPLVMEASEIIDEVVTSSVVARYLNAITL